jgi:Ca2+-binding RTX toxin-like protein
VGGLGQDTLNGGAGADQFVFAETPGAANLDHISDFTHLSDKVVLDKVAVFHALALGAATTAAQHILYNHATGVLSYDADGLGGAAAVAFAVLDGKPVMDFHDFLVI